MKVNEGDWVKSKKISRKDTAIPLTITWPVCLFQLKQDGRTFLLQELAQQS